MKLVGSLLADALDSQELLCTEECCMLASVRVWEPAWLAGGTVNAATNESEPHLFACMRHALHSVVAPLHELLDVVLLDSQSL